MLKKYFNILDLLTKNKFQYLAIGTWALKLAYPKMMKEYQVPDCDLVIDNDIVQIRKSIKTLKEAGWQISVWEKEVDESVSEDFLKGKYYLRAYKDELTLDLTYESTLFSFREMYQRRVKFGAYSLGHLEHILALKELKGRAKDLELVRYFQSQINI